MDRFKETLATLQEAVKAANSPRSRVLVVGLDSWEIAVRSDVYRDSMECLLDDDPTQFGYYAPYGTTPDESLLSMLDDVNQGWSAIEIEEDLKQAITQMLDLASSNPDQQAGILRHSRINGVLLYGPPGTGKTHLARVLAHEYGAVMIHVSAAELENKYVGETEKAIKGLFNLAAMVYPSIIFIDEADSLFRKRQPDDYDWTRSRLNTLLAQTDGLIKNRRQPFLLIATNHPGDLDEAILRRLRLRDIAARTTGFTGSDLHTVCVQAALIGQAEQRKHGGEQARRVLKHAHFEEALGRCGPTVSDSAMEAIREFAEKFDPSAKWWSGESG
uniref:AAA+ ATPase domain-containing protein n=1 Tax=Bionectria ochroleuca TaxID=29856 RepID=A0A0B7JSE5_BIOOC